MQPNTQVWLPPINQCTSAGQAVTKGIISSSKQRLSFNARSPPVLHGPPLPPPGPHPIGSHQVPTQAACQRVGTPRLRAPALASAPHPEEGHTSVCHGFMLTFDDTVFCLLLNKRSGAHSWVRASWCMTGVASSSQAPSIDAAPFHQSQGHKPRIGCKSYSLGP